MELWLCPRNKIALVSEKGTARIVNVTDPFAPLDEFNTHPEGIHGYIDDFVKKHKAVKALISGHEIPDDTKKILNVIDFGDIIQVRVLSLVRGLHVQKYLSFICFINEDYAFLQFYVDRKGKARCMGRMAEQFMTEYGHRDGHREPATLKFAH